MPGKKKKPNLTFEILKDPCGGKFHWKAYTVNRKEVAHSASYYGKKRDCLSSIETLTKHIKGKSFAIIER